MNFCRRAAALAEPVNHNADHVLLLDRGHADKVDLWVTRLGTLFAAVDRQPRFVYGTAVFFLPRRCERSGGGGIPGSARNALTY